jgi:hypothetical protein
MQDFKEMLGLNFDEQHLGGMLYDYWDNEKYYINYQNGLYVEGCKPIENEWKFLSLDRKYFYVISAPNIHIYMF